jgi:hypothetical protein
MRLNTFRMSKSCDLFYVNTIQTQDLKIRNMSKRYNRITILGEPTVVKQSDGKIR